MTQISNAKAAVDALKLAASYGANDDGTPMALGSAQALATLAVADEIRRIADQSEPKPEIATPPEPAAISHALRERIALTKDALNAIGVGYRADRSDFDGRTLRDQLDNVICDILLGDDVTTAVARRNEFEQWAAGRTA